MTAPLRLWAVVTPNGTVLPGTIRANDREAAASLTASTLTWLECVAHGYRLVRVTITIEADSDAK